MGIIFYCLYTIPLCNFGFSRLVMRSKLLLNTLVSYYRKLFGSLNRPRFSIGGNYPGTNRNLKLPSVYYRHDWLVVCMMLYRNPHAHCWHPRSDWSGWQSAFQTLLASSICLCRTLPACVFHWTIQPTFFVVPQGILSSHPTFCLHKSCKICLADSITGDANPRGSYAELTVESMPLLVTGCCFSSTL